MKDRNAGLVHFIDAIRIAQEAYNDAIRDMTEEDLLDEEERDRAIHASIEQAFKDRIPF